MYTVKINFDNKEAAENFRDWLDGQGEQDYWTWMEERENEDEGNITATNFKYNRNDLEINTECGRLSD